MSDDEEPDYLSDDFLAKCISQVSDIRPSLLTKHSEKRKHEQNKKEEEHKRKYKSIRHLEEERREEGLKTAIGEDNKGFQLLQKMGFKPGTTIGLNRPGTSVFSNASLKEPISVVVKTDRKGFGEKTKMQENRLQIEEWKQMRDKMSDTNEYRNRIRDSVLLRETEIDLRKAQSSCKNLDQQHGKEEPLEYTWFWPPVPKPPPDDETEAEAEAEVSEPDEIEVLEPGEKLHILTTYLRKQYFYCIWCGASYDDDVDLTGSCPGNSRQDH